MSQPETKIVTSRAQYLDMVRAIRGAVERHVPKGATVLVASKGDPELAQLGDRRAWHFPRGRDGGYAGFHPADAQAALAHLGALAELGAEYFLLPATSFWWLHHYDAFASHLDRSCTLIPTGNAELRLYRLARNGQAPSSPTEPARPSSSSVLPSGVASQLKSVLHALTAPDETIWLCAPNQVPHLEVPGRSVEMIEPDAVAPVSSDGGIESTPDRGVLVILHAGAAAPPEVRRLRRAAASRWTPMAVREHLCSLYRIHPTPRLGATTSEASHDTGTDGPETDA
jgi:hypothetical protein